MRFTRAFEKVLENIGDRWNNKENQVIGTLDLVAVILALCTAVSLVLLARG